MKGLLNWKAALGLMLALVAGVANAQETVEYIHTDALGSVVAITNAAGQVIERNEYEPYGLDLTGIKDGPGYTGHVSDAATGMTYMQQRYYDPQLGLFLSVDPVTVDGGDLRHFNRYAYAYNNPYTFTDPDGRAGRRCTEGSIACHSGVVTVAVRTAGPAGDVTATGNASIPDVPSETQSSGGTSQGNSLFKNGNIFDIEALAHDVGVPLLNSPEGVGFKIAGGGLMAVRLGRLGEDSVRALYNIGRPGVIRINGRLRIPDGINRVAGTINEVKNVQSLGFTRQLRDYADFARANGMQFNLFVRPGAQLSRPLREAEAAGQLTIREIPMP